MKDYTLDTAQIRNMKHAIGFSKDKVKGTKHRRYEAYRNYYTTSGNHVGWDNLCSQGLAEKEPFARGCGDNPQMYSVTQEGLSLLGEIMSIDISVAD